MKNGHQPKKVNEIGAPPKSGSSVANSSEQKLEEHMKRYIKYLKEKMTIRVEKEREAYCEQERLRVSLHIDDELISHDSVDITREGH